MDMKKNDTVALIGGTIIVFGPSAVMLIFTDWSKWICLAPLWIPALIWLGIMLSAFQYRGGRGITNSFEKYKPKAVCRPEMERQVKELIEGK